MGLRNLIIKENIKVPLTGKTKTEVICELVDLLEKNHGVTDAQGACNAVFEREALSTTGLGGGMAVPHAKTDAVKDLVLAIGVSADGVDFHSYDGQPVYVVFLLIAPKNQPGQHIEALAEIAKMMQSPVVVKLLRKASTAEEVWAVLSE